MVHRHPRYADLRTLVLVAGRMGDGTAVCYFADRADAELVLDLLAQPRAARLHYAEQLANFVGEQEKRPVWDRKCVLYRKGHGLFHLMPWRLAKWLARALVAPDSWRQSTAAQIREWLGQPEHLAVAGR